MSRIYGPGCSYTVNLGNAGEAHFSFDNSRTKFRYVRVSGVSAQARLLYDDSHIAINGMVIYSWKCDYDYDRDRPVQHCVLDRGRYDMGCAPDTIIIDLFAAEEDGWNTYIRGTVTFWP